MSDRAKKTEQIQIILQKMKDEGLGISANNTVYHVSKPRTCRNCSFLDAFTHICELNMPQKINNNYDVKDFKNPRNRYKYLPAGLCIKETRGRYFTDHSYHLKLKMYKFFKIFGDDLDI